MLLCSFICKFPLCILAIVRCNCFSFLHALRRKACRHEVTLKAREQMKCKLKDEIRMLYVIFSLWGQQSLQSPATRGLDLSPSRPVIVTRVGLGGS